MNRLKQNRGAKPKGQVKIRWSSGFAYAMGLIATDGSVSSDTYHIDLTTKDLEQANNFRDCLGLTVKIGKKKKYSGKSECYRIQFGDVLLIDFLERIGIGPAKTKTIGKLDIPDRYFFDFLRGHFDGDGTFYSYFDPRWRSSFMFYVVFISASIKHIEWIRSEMTRRLGVLGHVTCDGKKSTYQLKYAKDEGLKILKKMYANKYCVCLSRKRLKVEKALAIVGERL